MGPPIKNFVGYLPSPGESVTLEGKFSQTGVITFLPRGVVAISIIDVSVIVRCPQSKN